MTAIYYGRNGIYKYNFLNESAEWKKDEEEISREESMYDFIGKTYKVTRKPDQRIVKQLLESLDLDAPATVADAGAGTGNYSYELA